VGLLVLVDASSLVLAVVERQGGFEIGTQVVRGRFIRGRTAARQSVVVVLLRNAILRLLVVFVLLLLLMLLLLLNGRLRGADAAGVSLVGLRFGGC
jgi:hypothetical protein